MFKDTFPFLEVLNQSLPIREILRRMPQAALPNWYLGAGCLAQTIWNHLHDYDLTTSINDYDIVYFDSDLSKEKEILIQQQTQALFSDLTIKIDIVNQARVHLWYEAYFGYAIKSLRSVEEAIATWPVIATCIGVTHKNNTCVVYAPYGYDDLLHMIVEINEVWLKNYVPLDRLQYVEELYIKKVTRWRTAWPKLTIKPFDISKSK